MEERVQHELAVKSRSNLFKPVSWLAKIDFIRHLILFNNVLITVLAERQGGKSSFVSLLETHMDEQVKRAVFKLKAPCDGRKLTQSIAEAFHLKTETIHTAADLVAQINERKAKVLVILDDAQYLPESWLSEAMTALKQQGSQGYFHLCLVADFSIVASLNRLAQNQFTNLIHTIELGPLNETEAKVYMRQTLQSTEIPDKCITEANLAQFYKLTAGDMAKINANLIRHFKHCLAQAETGGKSLRRGVMTASVFAVLALMAYEFTTQYQSPLLSHYKELVRTEAQYLLNYREEARMEQSLTSQIPYWLEGAKRQLLVDAMPTREKLLVPGEEDEIDENLVLMDKVVYIPPVTKALQQAKAEIESKPLPSVVASFPGFPQPAIQPQTPPLAKVAAAKSVPAKNVAFTIQLLASRKADFLQQFARSHQALAHYKIYQVSYKDSTWYVLTMGSYSSLAQAKKAAQNLPSDLSKLNPWVRSTMVLRDLNKGDYHV